MPAPQFVVNTTRYDPYKNYRFRVKWDGRYVAAVSKVSSLTRTSKPLIARGSTDPNLTRLSPGQTKFAAITLERGVTHDVEFERWANTVWDYHNSAVPLASANPNPSLDDFRKDIVLELYNESGQKVMTYNIYRCWPSEFTALPDLDASSNAVNIQTLKLENEGWEQTSD